MQAIFTKNLTAENSIHGWRNVIHGWKCHPWMPSLDDIHRWRRPMTDMDRAIELHYLHFTMCKQWMALSMSVICHLHYKVSPSMDDMQVCFINGWNLFNHVWKCHLPHCSHRLSISAKIAPKLCKTWAKSDGWHFHTWMSKSHPLMKLSSVDVIHGWRN